MDTMHVLAKVKWDQATNLWNSAWDSKAIKPEGEKYNSALTSKSHSDTRTTENVPYKLSRS